MHFGESLSGYPVSRHASSSINTAIPRPNLVHLFSQGPASSDDMSYWHEVVHRFFNPRAVFRQSIRNEGDEAEKQYEILFPALARYFHTHFESGIKSMQLVLDKGTADRSLHGDYHAIENGKASLVYWFEGGSHVSIFLCLFIIIPSLVDTRFTWIFPFLSIMRLTNPVAGGYGYPSRSLR